MHLFNDDRGDNTNTSAPLTITLGGTTAGTNHLD
jgi:hypothetical protein